LDTGESVTGIGQGTFESIERNRWRTPGVIQISDGRTIAIEGEFDLATRVWSGQIFERN
jgi:hypothetical protein